MPASRGTPVLTEMLDLRKIFQLKALAKIAGISYDTAKDHFYGVTIGIRDEAAALRIKEIHSTCKSKGWI